LKYYGSLHALDKISLHIEAGELFFLLGPSGCGKTTLLRSIAGFVELDGGSIHIGDRDVTHVKPQNRHTGMVLQSYSLWPHLTVLENVQFGLKLVKKGSTDSRRLAHEALGIVYMDDHAHKKPNQLSGGQQQRVALARALAVRPTCLLLDEPLSNLDAKLRSEMRTEIRRICKESGLTGIYVTHDQKEALSVADRSAVMNRG
jgi:iron(III) transport system ATP-binding protein